MVQLLKRAPPAAKVVRTSQDLAIPLSSNEGPGESRLIVAQTLWGEANLSPCDIVFASAAIRALVVTTAAKFAVVAPHLSGRFTRLSDEIGLWIDAFEIEPVRFSLDGRKAGKVKRIPWINGKTPLPRNKFTALFLAQPSQLADSPEAIGRECALALRAGGQLFTADLFATASFDAALSRAANAAALGIRNLRDEDAHRQALAGAKLAVVREFDLSHELMTSIRAGFLRGVGKLPDIRALDQPWRKQRQLGFLLELEDWYRLYRMLESGQIAAKGFLVAKP